MPITEAPYVDERTAFVRALVEWAKDDLGNDLYREINAKAAAEQAKLEARHQHLTRLARAKRPGQKRPWYAAGFQTKQAWIDAGSPPPSQRLKETT